MSPSSDTDLLLIQGLTVDFDYQKPLPHRALDGVDLLLREGQSLGLVGQSGSGKTVLAHSILGLQPQTAHIQSGRILWKGENLLEKRESELRRIRGKEIAMIFQDPQASLNPVYPVGKQICWLLKLHRGLTGSSARSEALHLFASVKLPDPERCYRSLPYELSGGMCQRVMIAMALACRPKLLIADEPTSALDVTTQAEILSLLRDVRETHGISFLFISHDLRVVAELCDQLAVMQAGRVIASGSTNELVNNPKENYLARLIESAALTTPSTNACHAS